MMTVFWWFAVVFVALQFAVLTFLIISEVWDDRKFLREVREREGRR
jgi:heme exporter protein D